MRIELCRALRAPEALAEAFGLRALACGAPPARIAGLATDTRELLPGDAFLALPGENADGRYFLGEALARGASALIGAAEPTVAGNYWLFATDTPHAALLRAAHARRQMLTGTVVAVSGSAGKTTVKEALADILGETAITARSGGNFNSGVGMPLSLLGMEDAAYCVLEIGINHPGEMEPSTAALEPNAALLTNIGTAHIGNFGSRAALAAEKLRLAAHLRADGLLLLPETVTAELPPGAYRALRVGFGESADFRMENIHTDANGVRLDMAHGNRVITNLTWPIPGEAGAWSAAMAAAAALALGVGESALRAGLLRAGARTPRLCRYAVGTRLFLDDTYNASPESMLAALEALSLLACGRPSVAVLGDMRELGAYAEELHETVGEAAAARGVGRLYLCGRYASFTAAGALRRGMPPASIHCFAAGEEARMVEAICRSLPQDAAVLFKAARRAGFDRVAAAVRGML